MTTDRRKSDVRAFWERAACGEDAYLPDDTVEGFAAQASERYRLEPYILHFANFSRWAGKRVLEIGVGLGADHQRFAQAGADLWGIDLTQRAVARTAARFRSIGLTSTLETGDAENLGFPDDFFDLVYSWGVIHHPPDTARAAREILRVLRPGGALRVMIYHKWSIVGLMLWARYGLLAGRPFRGLPDIYAEHLESPGTQAFTRNQARDLFAQAENLEIELVLSEGDLLEGKAGQKHDGPLLRLARQVWPRAVIKRFVPGAGLFMLISGNKPAVEPR